jgi:pyruvate formate lyase activating enzyme
MSTGRIFDIQRFSIHDGPGIRTTVFLKGCPLRCLWCGNPESLTLTPLLSCLPDRCIACGECMKVCKPKAISADATGKAVVDRRRCTVCGDCVPRCDPKALELVGRDATVDEVLAVVSRDRHYYATSGGGMTLSGGDPVFQPGFAVALLEAGKYLGVHCCVETSGYAPWGVLERMMPFVDLWLYDYKETDSVLHRKFIGESNEVIVANLRQLHGAGAKILLRCPMIPGHNARTEHLDGIAALARELPNLQGVELLPYYDLWRSKLPRLGLTTEFPLSVKPPSRDTMKQWRDHLRGKGVRTIGA